MPTQIVIPPELQALVDKRLATGSYENAEDVLRRALEAQDAEEDWTDEEQLTEDERRAIADHIEEGFQQAERGELIDGDQVRLELAELREQRRKAHQLR